MTVILFAVAAVAAVVLIVNLLGQPPTVDYTSSTSGGPVNVTLQSVGTYGSGSHPTWVSYLVKNPQGQWVHTTVFQVPAHVRINVTIINYDSGSPLRNQQLGQVTGTYGNVATLNGKPFRVINSNAGNGVAHTFSMPSLGINIPLYGNNGNANLCGAAPCTLSSPHQVVRFSFTSPGPGSYRWQCFVPCGLGFLYGNGGPMSTLGYMGGFMQVAA
ncbi:MAG: hypothetical protein ACLQU9_05070 [Acidimicrobiales bacterium]